MKLLSFDVGRLVRDVLGTRQRILGGADEPLKLHGEFYYKLVRRDGAVEEWTGPNLITTAGKGLISGLCIGTGTAPSHIAIGIGTTAAAAGDTALQSEITTNGGQRASATRTQQTTTTTNDTSRYVVTFTFTGSFAVTEAGVLNASSSGTLLNRQVFSARNVDTGDTLTITYNVSFA